jgi:hypothetical protein
MQAPTCCNIRIRSIQDAHKIFYAIQRGLLHMVTRRLDADERSALGSGSVYAWEERGPHSEITGLGIERFTEGRRWSPSRVRDVCCSTPVIHTHDTEFEPRNSCFITKSLYLCQKQGQGGPTPQPSRSLNE